MGIGQFKKENMYVVTYSFTFYSKNQFTQGLAEALLLGSAHRRPHPGYQRCLPGEGGGKGGGKGDGERSVRWDLGQGGQD